MADAATIMICLAVITVAVSLVLVVHRVTDPKSPRTIAAEGFGAKLSVLAPAEQLVSTAPEDETPTEETRRPELRDAIPEDVNRAPEIAFWTAENARDEEARWVLFQADAAFSQNAEFWTTYHYEKRVQLGVENAVEALEELAIREASWVWPYVALADRASSQSDFGKAEAFLREARRRGGEHQDLVIGRLIAARLDGADFESAVDLARELSVGASSVDRAMIFNALSEAKFADNSLIQQAFREMSLRARPNNSRRFDVAYAYADSDDTAALSLRHYADLIAENYNLKATENNIGVEYAKLGEGGLTIRQYELAMQHGNALGACNLAHELVKSGFIDRARAVLDEFKDFSGYEENKASAEQKIASAIRVLDSARTKTRDETLSLYGKFQALFTNAEQAWNSGVKKLVEGKVFTDGGATAENVKGGIRVTLSSGEKKLSGLLEVRGPFAEGWITEEGASILSASRRRVLLGLTESGAPTLAVLSATGSLGADFRTLSS